MLFSGEVGSENEETSSDEPKHQVRKTNPAQSKGDEDDVDATSKDEVTSSKVALEHRKCLLGFMDTEIEQKLGYRASDRYQRWLSQIFGTCSSPATRSSRKLDAKHGLTLEARDEVDSKVVIDFEETFSSKEGKGWRPTLGELE